MYQSFERGTIRIRLIFLPMNKLTTYIRFYLPLFLWALVIFLFSSQPTGSASEIHWQDFVVKKSAHLFVYAVLATLSFRAFLSSGVKKEKALMYAVIFAMLYGASDEFHQKFTPGREPHIRDVIIDTIGASIPVYFIWKLLPKAPEKLRTWAKDFQLI